MTKVDNLLLAWENCYNQIINQSINKVKYLSESNHLSSKLKQNFNSISRGD